MGGTRDLNSRLCDALHCAWRFTLLQPMANKCLGLIWNQKHFAQSSLPQGLQD